MQASSQGQMFSELEVAIHRTISHHEQAIMALDSEIHAMMRTVRQLESDKLQHQAEIRRCKGIITLAIRLPPEILASIFQECIKDGWTRTPLTVSHVCSSWRRATSIPSVWSLVHINLDARDPYQRSRLWLDKSQGALLTIDINIGSDTTHLPKTMNLLSKEMGRWKALYLKSVHFRPVNQFLQLCGRPAPQLQAVNIVHDQDPLDINPSHLVPLSNSFINSSRFRTLHIGRRFLPQPGFIPTSISLLSLRLLGNESLVTQSIVSVLQLLDSLPLLSSFSLEVPFGQQQSFAMDTNQGQTIALSQLESVTLVGSNSIFGILRHLKLPGLTHLYLRSLESTIAEETGDWIALFLEQSSPPLILLEIRDLLLDSACFGRYFQLLPSLQDLRLHDADINDGILQLLNAPSGLCPHLTRLDFRWCGRLSGRALVALVQSRLLTLDMNGLGESYPTTKPVDVITVINCSFVKGEDIINLGEMTLCRLTLRDQDDYCHGLGCCENRRYRKRLQQRNLLRPSFTNIQSNRGVVL